VASELNRGIAELASSPGQPVLVVGGDGMLGRHLTDTFARSQTPVWTSTRKTADVSRRRLFLDLAQPPNQFSPPFSGAGIAILCAAITSQAQCEREPMATQRVNVDHTVALAERLVQVGMFVIFLSSNAVFDGEKPLVPADSPACPVTEYGRQKARTEARLLEMGEQVAIVRLTKVLAPDTALLKDWAANLGAGRAVHPFSDAVMAPISAAFTVDLVRRVATIRQAGVVQVSASQDISYEMAALHLAHLLSAPSALVKPASYRDAGIANMPRHTTLEPSSLRKLGLTQPHPHEALAQFAVRMQRNPSPEHS